MFGCFCLAKPIYTDCTWRTKWTSRFSGNNLEVILSIIINYENIKI